MDAALAMRSGDADSAQRLLTDALAFLSEVDARHYGAAAQYRLGALLGGAQGSGAIEEAMAWAKEQDVAAPERLFDLLCPGA
jgi:hypothetical protein